MPVTVLAPRDTQVRAGTRMCLGASPGPAAAACSLSLSASRFLPCRMGKGPDPVGSLGGFRPQATQSAKLGPPHHVTACERRPSLGLSLLLCEMGATAPLCRKGSMTVQDYSYSYLHRRGDPGGSARRGGQPRPCVRVCRRVTHSGWGAGRKADTRPPEGTCNGQDSHHLHAHPRQVHVTPTPTRPGVTLAAS